MLSNTCYLLIVMRASSMFDGTLLFPIIFKQIVDFSILTMLFVSIFHGCWPSIVSHLHMRFAELAGGIQYIYING